MNTKILEGTFDNVRVCFYITHTRTSAILTMRSPRNPASRANALELRFMAANADVQAGDLLTTSGVDGVYPPGLPVARVQKVERRVDSAFARISCLPLALVAGVGHVMVLQPISAQVAPRPPAEPVPGTGRKGGKK